MVIIGPIRTTIEMKPEHRERILELSAKRGEKGFSAVVVEAWELAHGAVFLAGKLLR
jgi:hypothetical protein